MYAAGPPRTTPLAPVAMVVLHCQSAWWERLYRGHEDAGVVAVV